MELIELIEVKKTEFDGTEYTDTYEVYRGDFVELYTSSANAYWHTVEWWQENYPDVTPTNRRSIYVCRDQAMVGYWDTIELFHEFIKVYLRGEVMEVVTP